MRDVLSLGVGVFREARGELEDRVDALRLGVDDEVTRACASRVGQFAFESPAGGLGGLVIPPDVVRSEIGDEELSVVKDNFVGVGTVLLSLHVRT